MIIVAFEVSMNEGQAPAYFDLAAALRTELETIDGFIAVERFESLATKGKYLSLSTWRDEAAVDSWREHVAHRAVQIRGRRDIFADFRIRVAHVMRDYGMRD
jgi:heme-degrading monooxygenase HmoA